LHPCAWAKTAALLDGGEPFHIFLYADQADAALRTSKPNHLRRVPIGDLRVSERPNL
jgi:hypothetical protein